MLPGTNMGLTVQLAPHGHDEETRIGSEGGSPAALISVTTRFANARLTATRPEFLLFSTGQSVSSSTGGSPLSQNRSALEETSTQAFPHIVT